MANIWPLGFSTVRELKFENNCLIVVPGHQTRALTCFNQLVPYKSDSNCKV